MEDTLWLRTYGETDLALNIVTESDPDWLDLMIEIRNNNVECKDRIGATKSELVSLIKAIDKYVKCYDNNENKFELLEGGLKFNFNKSKYTDVIINLTKTSDKYILVLSQKDLIKLRDYIEKMLEKYNK